MDVDVTLEGIENAFKEKILELQEEPEFQCNREQIKYAADADGAPIVKVAVGNVPVDYDLWEGLRNPAVVGLYPVGLREIWEFYSNRVKQKIDENGVITQAKGDKGEIKAGAEAKLGGPDALGLKYKEMRSPGYGRNLPENLYLAALIAAIVVMGLVGWIVALKRR